MAKAPSLRKDWNKGTQRTRKLSAGNARGMLRKWEGTLCGTRGSRRRIAGAKPGAVKAASPVLNGGDEETGLDRPRLVATQLSLMGLIFVSVCPGASAIRQSLILLSVFA